MENLSIIAKPRTTRAKKLVERKLQHAAREAVTGESSDDGPKKRDGRMLVGKPTGIVAECRVFALGNDPEGERDAIDCDGHSGDAERALDHEVDEEEGDGDENEGSVNDQGDGDHKEETATDEEDESSAPEAAGGDNDEHDGDANAQDGDEEGENCDDDDEDQDGARTRPRRVEMTGDVRVTPPQKYHDTWDAWLEYVVGYAEATLQVLPVAETMSWKNKNTRILATKMGKKGTAVVVPQAWDPYQRTYICTHGWKKKQRGLGKRPRQHIRDTGCPFRFVVQACPVHRGKSEKWRLVVKNGLFIHNHAVTPDTYGTYPVSRGIVNPVAEARVDGMLTGGWLECSQERSKIYDYLLDQGENVFKRDIDNMVTSHVSSITPPDDNDATAIEVTKFAAAAAGNVVSIDETDAGETGVLSLTTEGMRESYSRFPELLLVDCTHKTNRYNYQLMTFMVMNEFGEGIPVQQSLIEANGDWHMDRAVEHFKRTHVDRWKLLRVIMVDKDLNEIKILQSHFPEARIIICYFHVKKYLKEMCGKPEFGRISVDDESSMNMLVERMICAANDGEYELNRASLRSMCDRLGCPGFFQYMERCWNDCQDMWVMHRRSHLPHFRNNTNNMLESWFGKFKQGVNSDSTMAQCVHGLIAAARRKERDYKFAHERPGRFVNQGYDEELNNVLRFTTHYVAGKIEPEYVAGYAAGVEGATVYTFERNETEQVVLVHGPRRSSTVSLLDWSCTCEFAMSMKLPCRHAIAYRKHEKVQGSVIPLSRIDQRWTSHAAVLQPVRQFEYHNFDPEEQRQAKKQKKQRSQAERYREAVRATHLIASELAEIADEFDFREMLNFVLHQWRNVRQGRRAGPSHDSSETATGVEKPDDGVDRDTAPSQRNEHQGRRPGSSHDSSETTASVPHAEEDDSTAPTQPSDPVVELSQPHSLWSEAMGDVPIMDPTRVQFHGSSQVPGPPSQATSCDMQATSSRTDASTDAQGNAKPTEVNLEEVTAMKMEHAASVRTKSDSDFESDESGDGAETSTAPKIKINPRARKTGRKKTNHKQRAVDEAIERVRFNAAERARRELGVLTLADFANALDREKPGLEETHRRLASLTVKFTAQELKKPRYMRMRDPVLNLDAFYMLPATLLEAALKKFPLSNTAKDPIWVSSQDSQPSQSSPSHPAGTQDVEVVVIKDVGTFSRAQIEAMKRLQILKGLVDDGLKACRWLTQDVARAVPAHLQGTVDATARRIMSTYPFTRLPGLSYDDDFVFAILYRALPPVYLNDAIIRAFCVRIEVSHPSTRFAGFPSAKPSNTRGGRKQATTTSVNTRARALMTIEGVKTLLLPVNFGNAHWCGIVVQIPEKKIVYYDPMNQPVFVSSLLQLATSLVRNVFTDYETVHLDTPIQFDGYSCGVFVAWMFYRFADDRASTDMVALTSRRFELFYYVLNGSPPPSSTRPATSPLSSVTRAPPTTLEENTVAGDGGGLGSVSLLQQFERVAARVYGEDDSTEQKLTDVAV